MYPLLLTKEFTHFVPRAVKRHFFPINDRTPASVSHNYGKRYAEAHQAFIKNPPPLGTHLLWETVGTSEWSLIGGKVALHSQASVQLTYMQELTKQLHALSPKTIVEFGSGTGKNLMYLKEQFPYARCIGFELAQEGVDYAREAAKHYGLDVEFYQADLTKPLSTDFKADVVFTRHALEQIPRIFPNVIKNALSLAPDLLLFEPVPELYPWSIRGVVERARAVVIDRLRGLMPALKKLPVTIKEARALGLGFAFNETVFVRITTRTGNCPFCCDEEYCQHY